MAVAADTKISALLRLLGHGYEPCNRITVIDVDQANSPDRLLFRIFYICFLLLSFIPHPAFAPERSLGSGHSLFFKIDTTHKFGSL